MSYVQKMLRREGRRLLTARCTITRGTYPDLDTTTDVPCRVRPSDRATTEVTSGGSHLSLELYDVALDRDVDVNRGDAITFTRSSDPRLIGDSMTVVEVVLDEQITTRTAVCQRSREATT